MLNCNLKLSSVINTEFEVRFGIIIQERLKCNTHVVHYTKAHLVHYTSVIKYLKYLKIYSAKYLKLRVKNI